jgi:hypothetical protein
MTDRERYTDDKGRERYRDTDRLVDEVWDACVEVLGYEPKTDSEKKLWGKMTTSLKRAEATRERIVAVGKWYHKQWPQIDLTITALEKWYSHFLRLEEQRNRKGGPINGAPPCPDCGMGGGLHTADCPRAPKPVPQTEVERITAERVKELTEHLNRGSLSSE